MTQIYKPEIEQDDGYSIPKILVAVLMLILIGAGIYIYFQQKKLKSSVTYLLDSKKQVELDLNQMIEKYNLAIDDNSSLETNLKEERDLIIRYRDSIRNVDSKDLKNITELNNTVSRLKEESARQLANASAAVIVPVEIKPASAISNDIGANPQPASTQASVGNKNETPDNVTTTDNTATGEETTSEPELVSNEKVTDPIVDKTAEIDNSKAEKTSTTFTRVEIPPTYPGCTGTPTEKKACFSKKVQRHLSRKFDASIVDEIDVPSGTKRLWVHFIIDTAGNVADIRASGPHEKLEEEAVRVIKTIPKMKAARQNGKSVEISYSVPILIKVP